ncbi:2'-5' RNA ligase family protein [Streptomyces sp. PU-14G]|uniref:2'-5' RNA ligase family protein n=1 Tax=Streptomyces sp. PU-14G TaxID=2800808 RepID=UPI0034E01AF5
MASQTVNAFVSLRLPCELVDSLVTVQGEHADRVEPQRPDHMHITLGFLHDADAGTLADAAAVLSGGHWTAPVLRLTGEVRHGSWRLQKDPAYRYDDQVVQKQEQVRLGIERTPELTTLSTQITERLGIAEDGFWPHVTLGLARKDFPVGDAEAMSVPSVAKPALSVELQQEITVSDFRVLVANHLA